MSSLPTNLKSIGHYLKIANEHSKRDPVVYYWCLVYAVETGMKLDKKSPEVTAYLGGLLNTLEQVKKTLKGEEAISSELVAQAHIEQYALQLFSKADNDDRAGVFNKNVVKTFYTAGHLMDILATFGELDERIAENRKYAKWKAAYIHNCLRNGIEPQPGPMRGEGEEDDDPTPLPHQHPDSSHPFAANNDFEPPTPSYQEPPHPTGPSVVTGLPQPPKTGGVSASEIAAAQKLCKYAISALEYEDVPTAINNLTDALALINK